MNGQSRVTVVPITLPKANDVVRQWHRHHDAIPPGFVWFCLAAVVDGRVAGVAIAGRPTNRNNDNGQTVEVLRVASDGTPNVCSALLGACGKAGRAIGASRVITYTLETESGTSLKAAGWVKEAEGITSSWLKGTSRRPAVQREHMSIPKVRWALNIRPAIAYEIPSPDSTHAEPTLFGEECSVAEAATTPPTQQTEGPNGHH